MDDEKNNQNNELADVRRELAALRRSSVAERCRRVSEMKESDIVWIENRTVSKVDLLLLYLINDPSSKVRRCVMDILDARGGEIALIVARIAIGDPSEHLFGASIVGLATGVLGIAGGVFAHSSLMAKAKQMCGSNCACVQSAVNYHGWQGFCHTFEITSSSYVLAFMVANQSKLVNVRPEVWQWLQANGHGISPHQLQSAKRHIS